MHAPPDRPFAADEILNTLTDHAVDFVVIGGIAVQVHGCIRGTHDLDIVARPSTLNMTRLAEALVDLEAEHRLPGTLSLADPHELRRAPLIAVVTRVRARWTSSTSSIWPDNRGTTRRYATRPSKWSSRVDRLQWPASRT